MGARRDSFRDGVSTTGKKILSGTKKGLTNIPNLIKKTPNFLGNNIGKIALLRTLAGNIIPSGYRMPAAYINRRNEAKIEWKDNTTYDKIKTDETIVNYFQHNDIDFEGRDVKRLGTIGGMNKDERDMRYSQIAAVLVDFTTDKKINIGSEDDVNKLLQVFYKSGRNPTKYLTVLPGYSKSQQANDFDFGAYNIPEDENGNGINTDKMRNTLDNNIKTRDGNTKIIDSTLKKDTLVPNQIDTAH